MQRLIRDEDTLRRSLLDETGEDPEAVEIPAGTSAVSAGALDRVFGGLDAGAAPAPAPAADPDVLSTPQRLPESEPAAESRGLSRAGLGKVMQALYAAGTSKPLDASFWAPPKDPKTSDPLLAVKEELLRARIAKLQQPTGPGGKPKVDASPAIKALYALRPDLAEKLPLEQALGVGDFDDVKDMVGATDRKTGQVLGDEARTASRQLAERGQQAVQRRFDAGQLEKMGTFSEKLVGLTESMKQIERLAPGLLYGDVPQDYKLGDLQRVLADIPLGLGKRVMNPDAIALKGALDNLTDLLIRARTGAVINDQEFANYRNLLGTAIGAGPQAVAAVLPLFRREIAGRIKMKQLPLELSNPEAFEEWRGAGGLSYKDAIFADRDPQPLAEPPPDFRPATLDELKGLGAEALKKLQDALPTKIRISPPAPGAVPPPTQPVKARSPAPATPPSATPPFPGARRIRSADGRMGWLKPGAPLPPGAEEVPNG